MTQINSSRTNVARVLNRLDSNWDADWGTREAQHSREKALELVAVLLGDEEPIYAEARTSVEPGQASAPDSTFSMVAFTDDRIAYVTGELDGSWPTGTVYPRGEVKGLELRRTRLDNYSGLTSQTAAVTLHYEGLSIDLPLNVSTGAARALADHIAPFVDDRARSPRDVSAAASA
ncbi:hypothetical protein [Agrococcus beijingensis]|uniref:hypothetical protein n=1 Tax=Agrococcus beijingensis TaxID=3068634 RepID=UPI0027413ECF|nr:hypothetical protein [Agrococcus sp. REN33]